MQRRAGPGAIPTVCAQYPRDIALIEGRVETTARVSCPEVARLLLLHDDAIELVEQPAVLPPRLVATQVVEPDPADPWHRYYDDVRGTALALLGLEEVPLVTRQFLVAYFAKEVDAFYGPGRAVNEAGLANAVRRMRDPEFVAALIEQASALELPESLATAVAHHLLAHVVHVSGGAWEMVRQAYLTYATDGDDSPVWLEDADGEQQLKVRPAAFRARYRERAEAWEAAADERIDRYFTNYLVNAWMRGYLDAPSVTAFVRSLVLQTAILRFLLFSDPELPSPPADGPAQPDVLEALDRAAVRSVYRMSRATEHDPGYLERLDRTLDELGFTSFAHLVALLRS
ncbi:MAG: hypothetical protein D6701_09785 [Gemmatimonadetes bacterium]|nr:MAG: hypothetical protein D6701_09785 [Gemmatimonadota bacterium]